METQEVVKFIEEHKYDNNYRFIVTKDGRKEERRLFVNGGTICEFKKGSRKYGYYVYSVRDWKKIEVKDMMQVAWKNLQKINKYLAESGLWTDLAKGLKNLYTLGYDKFVEYSKLKYDERKKWEEENDCNISLDCPMYTLNRGIKSVNWESKFMKSQMEQAMQTKTRFYKSWTKGYDNNAEYNPVLNCAWYSEEYRGCGNGHYYIMIDYTHAIFGEDD